MVGGKGEGGMPVWLGYVTRHINQKRFQQVGRVMVEEQNIPKDNRPTPRRATRKRGKGRAKNISDKEHISWER